MKFRIIFLGTAQAIPTAKRNHTGILIKYEDENILIDCGEGIQRQLRKAGLHPAKITRILISHWHGDHILGIPGMLQSMALSNYNKTLYIYGPKGTKKYFSEIIKFFVFVQKNKLKIKIKELNNKNQMPVFETPKLKIIAEKMQHGPPCLAYSIIEKDKLRINKKKLKKLNLEKEHLYLLKKIKEGKDIIVKKRKIKAKDLIYPEKGRKITIIMDTKINQNMLRIAKNSDLLVCESTYGKEEELLAEKYKHLTSQQAAKIAKKSKAEKLVLTHISQRYENRESQLLREAKKSFKKTIMAEDLMELEL